MCGIAGFVDNNKNKKDNLRNMLKLIKHRGPDGWGEFYKDDVAIGHVRLSIIDLANGKQPMSKNGYHLTFNGEIYNYKELREELEKKGYTFETNSDTEVLLTSYIEYKEKCLNKLRGMFAFAIYNESDNSIFIARDHFGIKPVYYYTNNGIFMFASEIKAFMGHKKFIKELNKEVLPAYLSFNFVPTTETFFKNVYRLEPGHYLIYKNGKIDIKEYFTFKFDEQKSTMEESVKAISNVMKDSVKHHNIADVEVGSFLSSGVDSSYVVSLCKPQHTYTIAYKESGFSELKYAEDLTSKLNITNKHKTVSMKEYFKNFKTALYHLDEPLADPSIVPLYFLSKLASKDVKVVLSGEGADELFGGYNYYLEEVNYSFYNKIPYSIRHSISQTASLFPSGRGLNFLVRRGLKLEDGYIGVNKVFNEKERNQILLNKTEEKNSSITKPIYDRIQDCSSLAKMQTIDVVFWLVKDILLKADKMSMASSVEVRVPFLDKEVYEVARKLSIENKLTKDLTKVSLRKAAKEVIPTEAYKKKKLGFPVPLRQWIKTDYVFKKMYKAFNSKISKELFDNKALNKLLVDTYKGEIDNYKKAWTVYTFLEWYDVYFN